MPLKLRIFHKGILLVTVPLLFELGFIAVLIGLQHRLEIQLAREAHSKAVVYHANQLFICMVQATTGRLGAKVPGLRINARPEIIELQRQAVTGEIRTLKELVKNNPEQRNDIERLCAEATAMRDSLAELAPEQNGAGGGGFTALIGSLSLFRQIETGLSIIKQEVEKFTEPEVRLSEEIAAEQIKTRQLISTVLSLGIFLNVVMAFLMAAFFSKNITSRLKLMVDNTRRLTAGQTLRPPAGGFDEIASLDRIFHDMADALRDASEKERAIVRYAQELICSLDADLKFARMNPASEKVWGYRPEELIGTSAISLVAPEDAERVESVLRTVIHQAASTSLESRMRCRNGTLIDMLWSVYWSETEQSLFCVVYNISERKQIERLKQEFYSMVTHDLRSPLTSVYGVIKLLDAGAFGQMPEAARTKLVIAERNLERLLALINDLLDIEKLESGKMPLEIADTDMASVVELSIQAVEAAAAAREIEIKNETVSIHCLADANRLAQVIVNLLGNAIKFSGPASTITISCARQADSICLSVADQGRGIPAQALKSIFERFEQVEIKDARRNSGTGLGLSICRQIIEAHGGEIGVESSEGSGSTFWFKIPIEGPDAHPAETRKAVPAPLPEKAC